MSRLIEPNSFWVKKNVKEEGEGETKKGVSGTELLSDDYMMGFFSAGRLPGEVNSSLQRDVISEALPAESALSYKKVHFVGKYFHTQYFTMQHNLPVPLFHLLKVRS